MRKIFVFSDLNWSLGRVYRDIEKQLKNEFEFKYQDWGIFDIITFNKNYEWCDICITNLVSYNFLKTKTTWDFKKCIFISHGFVEHDNIEYSSTLKYGVTSDSLLDLFPIDIVPSLMPNGVDPDNFTYKKRDGTFSNIGWCGARHVWFKQFNWSTEISNKTNIQLKVASNLSYEDLIHWYNSIDLLIVTSIPEAKYETGPLPPFEAIVSGIPVIGTPVGNFRHVPGPKFKTVDEAVSLILYYKQHPEELAKLAETQYDYVMNNFTYEKLAPLWRNALQFS